MTELLGLAIRWVFPALIGYVTSDVISEHEQAKTADTIAQVSKDAAGTASKNWIKWVAFAVIGVALSIVTIVIFKIKKNKK